MLHGNYLPDVPRAQTYEWLVNSLRVLCRYSAERGVKLLLETVCFMYSELINTMTQAKQLIDDVGQPQLGVMYDVVQMNTEEKDLYGAMREMIAYCGHVHFADANRQAPGDGNLDFKRIISTLQQLNYSGNYSVELLPKPDQETAAQKAISYLRPIFETAQEHQN